MRTRRHPVRGLGLLLLLGGLGTGCTLLSPSTADGGNPACRESRDCPADAPLCRQFECVSRCADVECSGGEGERCDPATGSCIVYLGETCSLDLHCPLDRPLCIEGRCRGDRLDPCTRAPCAPGLDCVSVRGTERCLQPCAEAPCQVEERCLDASFGPLAAYCAPNLCRPGGGPEDTLVRAAEYGGPCEAAEGLEGICLGPLPDATLGDVGICLAPGLIPPGATCDPGAAAGSFGTCREGICSAAAGAELGTCFQLCSAWSGGDCPEGTGCYPQWGALGVCFELLPDAASTGGACQPPAEGYQLACEPGAICLPEDLGAAPARCLPICDPEAAKAENRSCAEGRCRRFDPTGNPFLGVCAAD